MDIDPVSPIGPPDLDNQATQDSIRSTSSWVLAAQRAGSNRSPLLHAPLPNDGVSHNPGLGRLIQHDADPGDNMEEDELFEPVQEQRFPNLNADAIPLNQQASQRQSSQHLPGVNHGPEMTRTNPSTDVRRDCEQDPAPSGETALLSVPSDDEKELDYAFEEASDSNASDDEIGDGHYGYVYQDNSSFPNNHSFVRTNE